MNEDEVIQSINSEYDLENLILNVIHEWEAKNDPDLVLNLSLSSNKTITEIKDKYRGLWRLTKPYIKVPYIPNNVTNLWCGEHQLIPHLPSSLKNLYLSRSTVYPELPDFIEILCGDFGNNVPRLPQNLVYFDCSSSDIMEIPQLPPKLETFICRYSHIDHIRAGDLPLTLKRLDLTYNSITHIESLPPSLEVLRLENNCLTHIPRLPTSLKCLICMKNKLSSLPPIPPSLKFIDYSDNLFTSKPELPETVMEYIGGEFGYHLLPEETLYW